MLWRYEHLSYKTYKSKYVFWNAVIAIDFNIYLYPTKKGKSDPVTDRFQSHGHICEHDTENMT